MTANAETTGQEAEKKSFLNRVSLRNKVIDAAVLVVLALLLISIPGDRNELLARQERVEAAQIAQELALPAVAPIMESVKAFLDDTGVDLSENRSYAGLTSTLTTFDRENSAVASRFQAVVTFSGNIHSLLDGANAIGELDTVEFRTLVAEMDTTLSIAYLALWEMNVAVDEYNGYYNWISAKVAGGLSGLPQGYADPIPPRSRLTSTTLNP